MQNNVNKKIKKHNFSKRAFGATKFGKTDEIESSGYREQ
jgi:hypothetical protein